MSERQVIPIKSNPIKEKRINAAAVDKELERGSAGQAVPSSGRRMHCEIPIAAPLMLVFQQLFANQIERKANQISQLRLIF